MRIRSHLFFLVLSILIGCLWTDFENAGWLKAFLVPTVVSLFALEALRILTILLGARFKRMVFR